MHHASPDLEPKSGGETAMDLRVLYFGISEVGSCGERRKGAGGTKACIPTVYRYIRARTMHKESSSQARSPKAPVSTPTRAALP